MYKQFLALLSCCFLFMGCDSDYEEPAPAKPANPKQEVVFSDFEPKEGPMRTRMFITGSNFGTVLEKIHVKVGGMDAKVIGSDGKKIYIMVPKKAFSGIVEVEIEGEDGRILAHHVFDEVFAYQAKTVVGTLFRSVNEYGESNGDITGPFEQASLYSVDFMWFASKKDASGNYIYREAYVSGWSTGVHKLDFITNSYEIVTPSNPHEMRSFAMTAENDTLLMPDDNGVTDHKNGSVNIYYYTRRDNFKQRQAYCYGDCAYTCASHPVEHTVFYQAWPKGSVWKMNGEKDATGKWIPKKLFELCSFLPASDGIKMNMIVHPTGKYMYIMGRDMSCILKSTYNYETHEFNYPTVFAGHTTYIGYQDGTGSTIRFSDEMSQGVFVKNPAYEGQDDEYDFYVADSWNDCVRILTPEGKISLYAGRANLNVDGKSNGYVDGDPITEARLHNCQGICYDPDSKTFYLGEWNNHAVRYITQE
ncbi:MAG: IPT/TIG domain-containing protein [Prevotella sp.]